MRYHISPRYKKLILVSAIFLIVFIVYLVSGESLAQIDATVIQGEKITARHIVEMAIWLILAVMVNVMLDVFIWEGIIHKRTGNPVPKLLKTTASGIVFLVTIILIVALVYHKSITGLLATTGALGLVIGLALRGIIENAIQGVALNVEQIFKTGDIISIPGKFDELAEVKDITMRNTYLQDFVGHVIAIPNSVICTNVIRNFSRSKSRTFSVCFSIAFEVSGLSVVDALRILNAVIASTDFVVQDPPPQVLISDIHNNQVKYDISCWTQRDKVTPVHAKHVLYSKIIEQLTAAGFSIGMPGIDFDEFDKKLAIILHHVDRFAHLNAQEKEVFYKHEMVDKRAVIVLNKVALFAHLNAEQIEDLSNHMRTLYFKAGETIINQGDAGDVMYILVEGALQVFIKAKETQEPIPVAKLTPGRYFGEMSLLVGDPRSATIVSLTDVMIYEITKDVMAGLFEQHPDMIEKISEQIAEQQLINAMKEKEFSTHDAQNTKRGFASAFMKKMTRFFAAK